MLTRKSAAQRLSRPSVTFFGFTKKSASEREQLAPGETHAETVASPDDSSSAQNEDTALHAFSAAAAPEYPDREPRPEVLEHTSGTPNAPAHESRTDADQTDTQPPRSAQALPNHAAPSSKAVAQSAAAAPLTNLSTGSVHAAIHETGMTQKELEDEKWFDRGSRKQVWFRQWHVCLPVHAC